MIRRYFYIFLSFFRKKTVRLIIGNWYIEKYGEPRKELLEKGFDLTKEYNVSVSLERLVTTYTQTTKGYFPNSPYFFPEVRI